MTPDIRSTIAGWRPQHCISPAFVIESPYAGDIDTHNRYLDRLIREVALCGGTPYASHRMLPGPLDDSDPAERQLGIEAGRAMVVHLWPCVVLFGTDYGWSPGMVAMREWLDSSDVMRGKYHVAKIGRNP